MKRLLPLLLLALACLTMRAQCPLKNTAFNNGERLEYKLYFNWKFVWLSAGTAQMTVQRTHHQGHDAWEAQLLTTTSRRIDKFFCMRDTLTSIVTNDLVPLYYRKGANEGGKYRLNEANYSYTSDATHVRLRYVNPYGDETNQTLRRADCVYDMLSMMLRARSLDGAHYKEGDRIDFAMADGKQIVTETLLCRGRKTIKCEEMGGVSYRCLVFSFIEKKGKKEQDIITFYISDDQNHLPLRLDMNLRFGVAKAYLTRATGLRNPQTSRTK